jgi:murein DD-endopeptidase MepM/ murein hydrolase activator NlpD
MPPSLLRPPFAIAMALAAAAPLSAQRRQPAPAPPPQSARLTMDPRQPSGATLTRLTIDRVPRADDSIIAITGEMAGEPLHFRAAGTGKLEALGAVPLDASDSVVARVRLERASGAVDSLRLFLKYPHQPPHPPAGVMRSRAAAGRRLHVDARFTRVDADTNARIERENETAREIGHKAQNTPQLFTQSFLRPRDSRVTSRFGTGRVFNSRVASSHLGVDYRGAAGDPIVAANRGVVALVDQFFLAGNVVYIDHGNGLVTGYFHLSKPEVTIGDTVERGQEIGLVGATGRVTGPHLHWSARFGALTIDPADLLAIGPPFAEKPAPAAAPAASTASTAAAAKKRPRKPRKQ